MVGGRVSESLRNHPIFRKGRPQPLPTKTQQSVGTTLRSLFPNPEPHSRPRLFTSSTTTTISTRSPFTENTKLPHYPRYLRHRHNPVPHRYRHGRLHRAMSTTTRFKQFKPIRPTRIGSLTLSFNSNELRDRLSSLPMSIG